MLLDRILGVTKSPRLRGTIRVLWFVALLNACVTALWLRSARAEAEASAKRVGLQLLEQLGPLVSAAPEELRINGGRMFFSAKSTELEAKQVLDRFEAHCRDSSAEFAAEVGKLPGKALASLPKGLHDPARWLTQRKEASDSAAGQVACFAPRKKIGGLRGLVDSMNETLETGDLTHVGDMRYVIARPEAKGQTLVLVMWTEGSFNIPAMFPETGDAPGSDPTHAPRPPKARRVLSAEIKGQPMALRMYDSQAAPHEIVQAYEKEMKARRWRKQALPSDGNFDINAHVSGFSKDNAAFIVTVHAADQGKTGVTLIDLGSRGFAEGLAERAQKATPVR